MVKLYCPSCHSYEPLEEIISKSDNVGIRITVSPKDIRIYRFFECHKCGHLATFRVDKE